MTTTQSERTLDITAAVGGQKNVDQLHKTSRDFRSDTFTVPTDAQLLRALTASRGDDVYEEDEDTAALEARIARLCGKEACLFGASGTLTNQLAIRTHMQAPPYSVITDDRAHVHKFEAGGIALLSQATTHAIAPSNGTHLTAADVRGALQLGSNIHTAPTRLVCLENTLSGTVFPQSEVEAISDLAHGNGIPMHLDGARLWNVAAKEIEERGLDPHSEADLESVLTRLVSPFDTASLCLSKGIGAPVGSALVGTKAFIDRCRWFRKMFGGGWRQVGPLASMADHALTHHFPRLAGTHALARRLADGLEAAGFTIAAPVDTNMVFWEAPPGLTTGEVLDALADLADPISTGPRSVLHHQTSPAAVDDFIAAATRLAQARSVPGKCAVASKGIQVLTPPSDPIAEVKPEHRKRMQVLTPPSDPVAEQPRKRAKLAY
ncbi:hypothetical protein CspeluHIS016_0207230 [Cutaneotrichosporon spelunceum]|uniref:Aromatic amino acid beta-eliminating lyase/threonine aldolase domain-containing protein n=1 Tax=Cutaneotrichosporon spelunceum TaxID=1672016 RepID=A0AAD3TRT1_9TREE|nr:hypothetical protein CspeluHIS016_0207230 [Cutaneotrichosporon spelunceum]